MEHLPIVPMVFAEMHRLFLRVDPHRHGIIFLLQQFGNFNYTTGGIFYS